MYLVQMVGLRCFELCGVLPALNTVIYIGTGVTVSTPLVNGTDDDVETARSR